MSLANDASHILCTIFVGKLLQFCVFSYVKLANRSVNTGDIKKERFLLTSDLKFESLEFGGCTWKHVKNWNLESNTIFLVVGKTNTHAHIIFDHWGHPSSLNHIMNEIKYSRRRLKIPFPCTNVVYLWNNKETHTGSRSESSNLDGLNQNNTSNVRCLFLSKGTTHYISSCFSFKK